MDISLRGNCYLAIIWMSSLVFLHANIFKSPIFSIIFWQSQKYQDSFYLILHEKNISEFYECGVQYFLEGCYVAQILIFIAKTAFLWYFMPRRYLIWKYFNGDIGQLLNRWTCILFFCWPAWSVYILVQNFWSMVALLSLWNLGYRKW